MMRVSIRATLLSERHRDWLVAALLLLLVARAQGGGFRDDDWVFLAHVRSAGDWGALLAPTGHFAFYRPAALLLFGLEHAVFGLQAGGYLIVNILLHATNAWIGTRVLAQLGLEARTARFAGCLFLLGCGHLGKQVGWVCASGPLASVTLSLLALWGAGWLDARPPARRALRRLLFAATGLALAAAPLFHESALVAPALVGIVLLRSRAPNEPVHIGRACVWSCLAAFPAVIWFGVLVTLGARYPAYPDATRQLVEVPQLLLRYPSLLLFPVQVSQWAAAGKVEWVLGSMCAAGALACIRRDRTAGTLCLWAYAVLVPFCLVPMPAGFIEPRYLYFAALPACGVGALLVARLRATPRRALRTAGFAAACGAVAFTVGLQWLLFEKYAGLARAGEAAGIASMCASVHDWQDR